jgi:hypothetical protein
MLKNAFNLKFEIEGFFTSDSARSGFVFYGSVLSGSVLYPEGLIRNVSTSFFRVEISS